MDVVNSGVLSSMNGNEISRQESIHELIYTNSAFLSDLDTLIKRYLFPLEADTRSKAFARLPCLLSEALPSVCGCDLNDLSNYIHACSKHCNLQMRCEHR